MEPSDKVKQRDLPIVTEGSEKTPLLFELLLREKSRCAGSNPSHRLNQQLCLKDYIGVIKTFMTLSCKIEGDKPSTSIWRK